MDIDVDQRRLGDIDIQSLHDTILSQDEEAWHEALVRQQTYEVHRDTESIVMLFCDESWPDGEIYQEAGWECLQDVAMPLVHHVIETFYTPGGIVLRAMAVKLVAGGRIPPHRDSLSSFHIGHRIHVPITSNPGVQKVSMTWWTSGIATSNRCTTQFCPRMKKPGMRRSYVSKRTKCIAIRNQ